jgi:hypothetical protein
MVNPSQSVSVCVWTCSVHSPLLGTSDATREFHSKVLITQDLRIYVNVRTKHNIAITNTDCEGFPITHSYLLSFILFFIIF